MKLIQSKSGRATSGDARFESHGKGDLGEDRRSADRDDIAEEVVGERADAVLLATIEGEGSREGGGLGDHVVTREPPQDALDNGEGGGPSGHMVTGEPP